MSFIKFYKWQVINDAVLLRGVPKYSLFIHTELLQIKIIFNKHI